MVIIGRVLSSSIFFVKPQSNHHVEIESTSKICKGPPQVWRSHVKIERLILFTAAVS